ncbi:5024_t:CDS:2 [Entrophospora sp. SA101]|nr:5024_t:CDS:2 [Entrophospora sp. SA101]
MKTSFILFAIGIVTLFSTSTMATPVAEAEPPKFTDSKGNVILMD